MPTTSQRTTRVAHLESSDASVPTAVAYALPYDSSVEAEDGVVDVLIIETGDAEDEEAHEFAKWYSREDREWNKGMARLRAIENLLK